MTEYLSEFSSGQVVVDEKSVQKAINSLDRLDVIVYDAFHWKDGKENTSGKLYPKKIFEKSSEHLVIFCELDLNGTKCDVIVKYKLIMNGRQAYVQNMTKDHCDSIIKNYNLLSKYLKVMKSENIDVVSVLILRCKQGGFFVFGGSYINLWVEKQLNFVKFWAFNGETKDEQMANTSEPELKKLQKFIYILTSKQFTICDLQGENENGKFTLCDIEYTNTLGKLGWKNQLIEEYAKTSEREEKEEKEKEEKEKEEKKRQSICILV